MITADHMLMSAILHYHGDSANPAYIRAMANIEHDDPEQAPTYNGVELVNINGNWLTPETAEEVRKDLENAA